MRNIFIIFKKEFIDTIRDRRTIFMMVLLPLLLVPVFITGFNRILLSQERKSAEKTIIVGIAGYENAPSLMQSLSDEQNISINTKIDRDSLSYYVQNELIDGALIIDDNFQSLIANYDQANIQILHKGSDAFASVNSRLIPIIENLDSTIVAERIFKLNLKENIFDAIYIQKTNLSSIQEIIGKTAGGFLPYLFIIFGFIGAMYPGIDLGAGEKERGTLETLLSTPAARNQIVIGKFLVVMLAAIITAIISMSGIFIGAQLFPEIPDEFMSAIKDMFSLKMLLLLLTLIIPISTFFSGLILSLSIFAKSFKEAQSMITPFNIVIIFPALLGTLPGIELNHKTALIPIINVSLATKEVLAGSIEPLLLAEVYISLFILAGLSLWFCVKWFNREQTLFRI